MISMKKSIPTWRRDEEAWQVLQGRGGGGLSLLSIFEQISSKKPQDFSETAQPSGYCVVAEWNWQLN